VRLLVAWVSSLLARAVEDARLPGPPAPPDLPPISTTSG